jgi:CCR4-NOT complex subunit CAF16
MVIRTAKVTVDLDVQVRDDLLTFLKEDSQHRNATILCGSGKSLMLWN